MSGVAKLSLDRELVTFFFYSPFLLLSFVLLLLFLLLLLLLLLLLRSFLVLFFLLLLLFLFLSSLPFSICSFSFPSSSPPSSFSPSSLFLALFSSQSFCSLSSFLSICVSLCLFFFSLSSLPEKNLKSKYWPVGQFTHKHWFQYCSGIRIQMTLC